MVELESVMPQTGRPGVHGPVSTSKLGFYLGLSVSYGFFPHIKIVSSENI